MHIYILQQLIPILKISIKYSSMTELGHPRLWLYSTVQQSLSNYPLLCLRFHIQNYEWKYMPEGIHQMLSLSWLMSLKICLFTVKVILYLHCIVNNFYWTWIKRDLIQTPRNWSLLLIASYIYKCISNKMYFCSEQCID